MTPTALIFVLLAQAPRYEECVGAESSGGADDATARRTCLMTIHGPSVVEVTAFNGTDGRIGSGTGIVVESGDRLTVATAYHVIEGAKRVNVRGSFAPSPYSGCEVAVFPTRDLAYVRCNSTARNVDAVAFAGPQGQRTIIGLTRANAAVVAGRPRVREGLSIDRGGSWNTSFGGTPEFPIVVMAGPAVFFDGDSGAPLFDASTGTPVSLALGQVTMRNGEKIPFGAALPTGLPDKFQPPAKVRDKTPYPQQQDIDYVVMLYVDRPRVAVGAELSPEAMACDVAAVEHMQGEQRPRDLSGASPTCRGFLKKNGVLYELEAAQRRAARASRESGAAASRVEAAVDSTLDALYGALDEDNDHIVAFDETACRRAVGEANREGEASLLACGKALSWKGPKASYSGVTWKDARNDPGLRAQLDRDVRILFDRDLAAREAGLEPDVVENLRRPPPTKRTKALDEVIETIAAAERLTKSALGTARSEEALADRMVEGGVEAALLEAAALRIKAADEIAELRTEALRSAFADP